MGVPDEKDSKEVEASERSIDEGGGRVVRGSSGGDASSSTTRRTELGNVASYWENEFEQQSEELLNQKRSARDVLGHESSEDDMSEEFGGGVEKMTPQAQAEAALKKEQTKAATTLSSNMNVDHMAAETMDDQDRYAKSMATPRTETGTPSALTRSAGDNTQPSDPGPVQPGAVAVPGIDSTDQGERSPHEVRRRRSSFFRGFLGASVSQEDPIIEAAEEGSSGGPTSRRKSSTHLAMADPVDAESVVYAENVSMWKRNQAKVIALCVLVGIIAITLAVVYGRQSDPAKQINEDEQTEYTVCDAPVENQTVLDRCYCSNGTSTFGFYEELEPQGLVLYQYTIDQLEKYGIITEEEKLTWDRDSCDPANQGMFLATDIERYNVTLLEARQSPTETILSLFVLIHLYIELSGRDWLQGSQSWFGDSIAICTWHGINCILLDVVSEVVLPNNKLAGQIPKEIGLMGFLRVLDFSSNPGITGTIPDDLSRMTALKELNLKETRVSGAIPSSIGLLRRLDTLILAETRLSGSIPGSLFDMDLLRILDLQACRLSGPLPDTFEGASSIQQLLLGVNRLSGTLPESLGNMTALEILDLSGNAFEGTIPSALGYLTNLEFINLYASGLEGAIPESFCENRIRRKITVDCEKIELCSCCTTDRATTKPVMVICGNELPGELASFTLEFSD